MQDESAVVNKPKAATPADMGAVSVSLGDDDDDGGHDLTLVDDTPPDYSDIVPMGDFILVWPVKAPNKKGSIIIPEGARTSDIGRDEGIVLQVGPDCKRGLVIGDLVFYYRHAGSWQVAPDEDTKLVRLMKDHEVYGRRKRESEKEQNTSEGDSGASAVSEG